MDSKTIKSLQKKMLSGIEAEKEIKSTEESVDEDAGKSDKENDNA